MYSYLNTSAGPNSHFSQCCEYKYYTNGYIPAVAVLFLYAAVFSLPPGVIRSNDSPTYPCHE